MNEDTYYARVQPIIGDRLRDRCVALLNTAGAEVARLLAACRVEHFCLPPTASDLAAELRARYGTPDVVCSLTDADLRHADLLIGGGDAADLAPLATACASYGVPGIAILPNENGGLIIQITPTSNFNFTLSHPQSLNQLPSALSTIELSHHTARLARSVLLGAAQREDCWYIGGAAWPWRITAVEKPTSGGLGGRGLPSVSAGAADSANPQSQQSTIRTRQSAIILGCGSLGSYAARNLALAGIGQLWLFDDETVEAVNPVRQFYTRADMGQAKAIRLAANIAALGTDCMVEGINFRYTAEDAGQFAQLVTDAQPDVVILTTGTAADYQAARLLWQMRVPHLVARCYRRARYFEVVTIDAGRGPCYDCVRGHLYTGPSPSLTPEQRAAYDNTVGADDNGELAGEPATLIESGYAAAVATRLAMQLAQPEGERADWFRACMDDGAVCFLGGNVAEQQPNGWAYGITTPGQVVVYGVSDILGSAGATALPCPSCGQTWRPGRIV